MPTSLSVYLEKLGRLSAVKATILGTLWEQDTSPFPKPWVTSNELLELTGQKYFDRRTRELRDESGCDIETAHVNGMHSYRLKSGSLNALKPREYLTEIEKRTLFSRFKNCCQICGKTMVSGVRGLQADHKVPLMRGGSKDLSNWQPVCNDCNVGKRGACANCNDDCNICPWAFPENTGRVSLVRFPPDVLEAINSRFGSDQKHFEAAVVAILRASLIDN